MKKRNVTNLIKYYAEGNDAGFRSEAYQIAKDFDASGDYQLAEYIMALMSNSNVYVPQLYDDDMVYLEKVAMKDEPLPLPKPISDDILGILHAISSNVGISKYLFAGAPGTGKTETAKQVARLLERELYSVDFSAVVDSRLGQTQKNIAALFKELNGINAPERVVILFDEIDAIALDRTNSNDLREMGRATSAMLKGFDILDERIVIIATTNMLSEFDKAVLRRFDKVVNFDRYTIADLVEIGESILDSLLTKFKSPGRNVNLFRKIVNRMNPQLSPGELKNAIKTAVAFGNSEKGLDYLRRLYYSICSDATQNLAELQSQGFTLREIEILTGVSKSQAARELKE